MPTYFPAKIETTYLPESRRESRDEYNHRRPKKYRFDLEVREAIRTRAQYQCEECGITEAEMVEQLTAMHCDPCQKTLARTLQAEQARDNCFVFKTNLEVLQCHHRIPVSFAKRHNLDERVVSHPAAGVCLCSHCHNLADEAALSRSEEETMALYYEIQAQVAEEEKSAQKQVPARSFAPREDWGDHRQRPDLR